MQEKFLATEEFAARFGVKGSSVRHHVWEHGSYFGYLPTKALNGRLRWPDPDLVQPNGEPK